MMQTVQLSITDSRYEDSVREALARSCAWRVESVERPDPSHQCVMVLDEQAFARLPLPLSNPERVVLITHLESQDSQFLAQAWEAGLVSIVSEADPLSTVLLAIMAAALRVAKIPSCPKAGEITPDSGIQTAPISSMRRNPSPKRCKIQ